MTKYIGITIGPIFETIMRAENPTTMWFSSFMFSYLSKTLVENLVNMSVVKPEDIISPYFADDKENRPSLSDGVGLYHDRIIFKSEDPEDFKKVKEAIRYSKQTVSDKFAKLVGEKTEGESKVKQKGEIGERVSKYVYDYLSVKCCSFDTEDETINPILKIAKRLNALEKQRIYPEIFERNIIPSLYVDLKKDMVDKTKYENLLENFKVAPEEFSLYNIFTDSRGETINELLKLADKNNVSKNNDEKISAAKATFKRSKYYVVMYVDGDNVTETLKGLKTDDVREFSRNLLAYSTNAVNTVKAHGGYPIYAGGDDLLALLPAWHSETKDSEGKQLCAEGSFLDIIKELNKLFKDNFQKSSLSFGFAVRYYKFPLYETFESASEMLDKSKHRDGGNGEKKNATSISLLKHSGQLSDFMFGNNSDILNILSCLIKQATKPEKETEEKIEESYFNSVSYKIDKYSALFDKAAKVGPSALENVFDNIFDDGRHEAIENQLIETRKLYEKLDEVSIFSEKKEESAKLDQILRFVKFFSEKGDEEHD